VKLSWAKRDARARWGRANADKVRGYKQKYYQANLAEVKAKKHAEYMADPKKAWAYQIERKYGLTPESYDELFASQDYACVGCGTAESVGDRPWHIDHEHRTNIVRGILCKRCNLTLGHAKDNPATLRKLAAYLEKEPLMNLEAYIGKARALKAKIKEIEEADKARLAPYKDAQKKVETFLLGELTKMGAQNTSTPAGGCHQIRRVSVSLEDPDEFMRNVIGTEAWELLDRKANVTAVEAYMAEHNILPPGVKYTVALTLGLTAPVAGKKKATPQSNGGILPEAEAMAEEEIPY
jgi:hypothetical protein